MSTAKRTPPIHERFSIKDLELFSGIKAHTIRAWERRHGLLKPARSNTNIRSYSVDDLRTILNISLLLKDGLSISQISAFSDAQRDQRIKEDISRKWGQDDAMNTLKLATVGYDEALFERTSRDYQHRHGFENLVEELYLPLLNMIGLLWQSSSICAAQEHFTSNLVRQKLVSAIDALPMSGKDARPAVLLYLPENEIHELGLLYLQYRLRSDGHRSIYLGASVPIEDLVDLARQLEGPFEICSILTVYPQADDIQHYMAMLEEHLPRPDIRFHFCGPAIQGFSKSELPERISVHATIPDMLSAVNRERD